MNTPFTGVRVNVVAPLTKPTICPILELEEVTLVDLVRFLSLGGVSGQSTPPLFSLHTGVDRQRAGNRQQTN
jgi:hypothetical protein